MSALIYYAIPAFLLTVALEALWASRARRERSELRGYEARDTWASLAMGVGNVLIAALVKGAVVTLWVTKNLETFNPICIAFHEWIAIAKDALRARSLRDALGYVFGPPGWAPGGGQTSKVLRAQASSDGR